MENNEMNQNENMEQTLPKKVFLARAWDSCPKPIKFLVVGAAVGLITIVGGKAIMGFMDDDVIPGPSDDLPFDDAEM